MEKSNMGKKAYDKEKDIFREIISWIMWIAGAAFLAAFVNSVLIVNANVTSGSMEKTIMTGDRVVGLRVIYAFGKPQRGDIIVFENPTDPQSDPFVKRVIGLPGETINIVDGKVYINDASEPLDESSYLWENMDGSYGPFAVPEESYFVMGDNRNHSWDSRDWGFVPMGHIKGKVYIDLFPHTKFLY